MNSQPILSASQLVYLGPVLCILATVLLLLIVDVIMRSARATTGISLQVAYTISMIGVALAAVDTVYLWHSFTAAGTKSFPLLFAALGQNLAGVGSPSWTGGALCIDYFGLFVCLVVCLIVLLVGLNLLSFLRRSALHRSELFPLLLLSASGMMLLGFSRDLLVTFIAIEILSLPLYVMCGLNDRDRANKEASLKYFLLGAFASGFFIYGAALVYGAVGHLNYSAIAYHGQQALETSSILLIGVALVGAGLAFKLALVPFHAWVPDVYQGAPTPVTSFMAAGVKLAVFAAALRLLLEAIQPYDAPEARALRGGIALLAGLSMIFGNLLALHQMSAKRLLAYSAIAHTGYIAVGLAAGIPATSVSLLVYLVGYGLAAIGAFALITYLSPAGQDDIYLDEMHDLAKRAPVSAMAFTILLLSMAGFPLTIGFIGKLMVFTNAWQAGLYGLVIFAVLNSVVSVYYYLRFIVAMYMQPRAPGAAELVLTPMPAPYILTGIITVGLTLLLGIAPHVLIDWAQSCLLRGL